MFALKFWRLARTGFRLLSYYLRELFFRPFGANSYDSPLSRLHATNVNALCNVTASRRCN